MMIENKRKKNCALVILLSTELNQSAKIVMQFERISSFFMELLLVMQKVPHIERFQTFLGQVEFRDLRIS